MKTIAERVAYAIKKAGTDQSKLARCIGIKPQAIQQILSGKTKRSSYLPDIAAETGFNLKWIMTGKGRERMYTNFEGGPKVSLFPLISWVAAGRWCEAVDPYQPGDAEDWMPCPANCSPSTEVSHG